MKFARDRKALARIHAFNMPVAIFERFLLVPAPRSGIFNSIMKYFVKAFTVFILCKYALFGQEINRYDEGKDRISELLSKASTGDIESQYKIGLYYYNLNDKEDRLINAYSWFLKGGQNGHGECQRMLGIMNYKAEVLSSDSYKRKEAIAAALNWQKKAVESGNIKAYYNLGEHYEYGEGVIKDVDKAYEYFKIAAQNEYAPALYKVAEYLYEEKVFDALDFINLYKKSADKGYGPSLYKLARLHLVGLKVKKDTTLGLELLEEAAKNGQRDALRLLGSMYAEGYDEYGIDIDKDLSKATEYLKRAADKNEPSAQEHIGRIYLGEYESSNIDYIEAYKYFFVGSIQGRSGCVNRRFKMDSNISKSYEEYIIEGVKRGRKMLHDNYFFIFSNDNRFYKDVVIPLSL